MEREPIDLTPGPLLPLQLWLAGALWWHHFLAAQIDETRWRRVIIGKDEQDRDD
jgi:hypothetical protein